MQVGLPQNHNQESVPTIEQATIKAPPDQAQEAAGSVVTQPEICSRSTTFLWKIGADSEQDLKKKEEIGAKKILKSLS